MDGLKILSIKRIEWITALLLSAVVLFLLIVRATHAGALWRDECETLQLARMPTLGDITENIQYTSLPVPFVVIVRVFTSVFGTSDISIRCFGLTVGLAFICVAWYHARSIRDDVPLLLLALIGLNSIFLTVGTQLRGYGLGSVFIVLAFSLTAKVLLKPTGWRLAGVLLAYLACMQSLLLTGVLVPALMVAAATVWWFRGQLRWILILLGVACICGLSCVPYVLRTIRIEKQWAAVVQVPDSLGPLWQTVVKACGPPSSIMPGIWITLIVLSLVGAGWRVAVIWRTKPAPEWDLLLFGSLTILVSVAAHHAFLWAGHNILAPRYFVPLLSLLAVTVDVIVANFCRFHSIRVARVICTIAATIGLPFAAWPKITERQTNIDFVAQLLQEKANADDLIVINTWTDAVSFNWYYHGPTGWITVPMIDEHRIHRYDLLKEKMMSPSPLEDLEREISEKLRLGKRIWFVGNFDNPNPRLSVSPAPDPKFGWQFLFYRFAWSEELSAFIQDHSSNGRLVAPEGKSISADENFPVWVAEGWRE